MNKYSLFSFLKNIIFPAIFCFAASSYATQSINPDDYPGLDAKQLGHVRHIVRLAGQLPGEWAWMGTKEAGQEGDDALRFQLAYMHYAMTLAHYHWLPAYRELYQDTSDKLIQKMLRPEVWSYWELASQGSKQLDPNLEKLDEGWIDPVIEGNTMYSGHLHAMVGMHTKLYADDKYLQPDSLTFKFEPVFRGLTGPQYFKYDFASLNDAIYQQMVKNDWLGLECEPNAVFIICNQLPFLGFRFFDQVKGTNFSAGTADYEEAWKEKGWATDNKHIIIGWLIKQNYILAEPSAGMDAGTGMIMNAWNRDYVRSLYSKQKDTWIKKVSTEQATVQLNPYGISLNASGFGLVAAYAAEMGDMKARDALLNYADQYFGPSWEDGAYYYPRNDLPYDEENNTVFVPRVAGNALFAYARLNPGDGMWKLYNEPWGDEHYSSPYISDVQYPEAQVTQAWFDQSKGALILGISPGTDFPGKTSFYINNLDKNGNYEIVHNGKTVGKLKGGKYKARRRSSKMKLDWEDDNQVRIELGLDKSHSIVIRDLSI